MIRRRTADEEDLRLLPKPLPVPHAHKPLKIRSFERAEVLGRRKPRTMPSVHVQTEHHDAEEGMRNYPPVSRGSNHRSRQPQWRQNNTRRDGRHSPRSPRRSGIPRPPAPGSPTRVYPPGSPTRMYPPPQRGISPFFIPAPSVPRPDSPVRHHHQVIQRHSSTILPGPEEIDAQNVRQGEHQRNISTLSAPTGGHTRDGSSSSGGGREICRYFLRTGKCGYGARCRYEHPRYAQGPALNSLGYPLREGECVCRFFVKNSWCAFGTTCKFHHPEPPHPQRQVHSPPSLSGAYPRLPYSASPQVPYSASPPLYSPAHAGMYPVVMPATAMMSPPPPHPMAHGVHPYMMMHGMPHMVPPAPWPVAPPMPPMEQRRSKSGEHGDGDTLRETTESDVSTTSVVSGAQHGYLGIPREESGMESDGDSDYGESGDSDADSGNPSN